MTSITIFMSYMGLKKEAQSLFALTVMSIGVRCFAYDLIK